MNSTPPPPAQSLAVSVITPVYNAAATLPRMLGSVLNQTLGSIEHIVIDNGSTDGSGAMLDEYRAAHPERRISVIHQANSGSGAAPRNRGLDAACGEYVAFLDSDDYLEANFCEALYRQAAAENAEICKGECIKHAGGREYRNLEPSNAVIRRVGSRLAFWNLFWTAIYRRQLLAAHHIGFDSKLALGEDHLFLNEAVLACRHLALCDGTAYHYCIRAGSEADAGAGISPGKITSVLECYSRIARNLCGVQAGAELQGVVFALASHLAEMLFVFLPCIRDPREKARLVLGGQQIYRQCPAPLQNFLRNVLYSNYPQHTALLRQVCS